MNDEFRNRVLTRERRPDGRFDLRVTFWAGSGESRRVLDEYVLPVKLGPEQIIKLGDQIDDLLGSAYLQGRNNERMQAHGPDHIPTHVKASDR